MNIAEAAKQVVKFRQRIDAVKNDLGPQPFPWYPYDSFGNFMHLERLLTGPNRDLLALTAGKPVLDIGCADGEVGFFLESLGCEVVAVDYPPTNHNSMAGVRKLKEALGSRIEILPMDVDTQFTLPEREFGLAFILGALYHLKNPFYLLESVSKRARRAILSTRIARTMPGVNGAVGSAPLAYLLSEDELNGDNSNYWIFTDGGFRRILERSNWRPLDYMTFGDTVSSDPVSLDHDERVFCLAASQFALANVELLEGWHGAEAAGWRWTAQSFAVRCHAPRARSRARLAMKLYVPAAFIERWGSVRLAACVDGRELAPQTYTTEGDHEFTRDLGPADGRELSLRFTLDHALPPSEKDDRELGMIVASLSVE